MTITINLSIDQARRLAQVADYGMIAVRGDAVRMLAIGGMLGYDDAGAGLLVLQLALGDAALPIRNTER